MTRRSCISASIAATLCPTLASPTEEATACLRIILSPDNPADSYGQLGEFTFPVGLGRDGVTPAGQTFRGGSSLLGSFRINAILSAERFEMDQALIAKSDKSPEWLKANLFKNMSSIDFDGDGKGGEYGDAFISLEPTDSPAKQPFHFGKYKGTYRWYSYAIHGTQNQDRIGRCVTGGCVNVGTANLTKILAEISLGLSVKITAIHSAK